jgi:hypothetical protein
MARRKNGTTKNNNFTKDRARERSISFRCALRRPTDNAAPLVSFVFFVVKPLFFATNQAAAASTNDRRFDLRIATPMPPIPKSMSAHVFGSGAAEGLPRNSTMYAFLTPALPAIGEDGVLTAVVLE